MQQHLEQFNKGLKLVVLKEVGNAGWLLVGGLVVGWEANYNNCDRAAKTVPTPRADKQNVNAPPASIFAAR